MNKLIIQNDTDIPLANILGMVREVVETGRISNNGTQYAYLTVFGYVNREIHVATDLNKKSDRFVIYEKQD